MSRMADALSVLANPYRLSIIEHLDLCGEASVTHIQNHTGIAQATLSNHLSVMRRAGFVERTKKGRYTHYHIANPNALVILNCIRKNLKAMQGSTTNLSDCNS